MATTKVADIKVTQTPIKKIDLLAQASGRSPPYIPPTGTITLVQYHPDFSKIISHAPHPTSEAAINSSFSLLASSEKPFFHEACVYTPSTSELWITSNGIPTPTPADPDKKEIFISRLKLSREKKVLKRKYVQLAGHEDHKNQDCDVHLTNDSEARQQAMMQNAVTSLTWTKMKPPPGVSMPNGGVNHPGPSSSTSGILICAQGTRAPASGGIYHISTSGTIPLVTNYLGREFNSPNDVVVAKDGAIWFTDPSYGHDQGFKNAPVLPEQVYRYDPKSGACRVMADGFGRPNGICFDKEETTCYITDTSTSRGSVPDDPRKAATIYAFSLLSIGGHPQLTSRRVFAFPSPGFPDGIKTDLEGNVYSGCGDGVHVWNKGGTFLGKIATGDWVANFCFGEGGEMFVCNERRVWRVQLGGHVRGALVGVGKIALGM